MDNKYNLNNLLAGVTPERRMLAFSKLAIANEPDTRERDLDSRSKVILLESLLIRNRVDLRRFRNIKTGDILGGGITLGRVPKLD